MEDMITMIELVDSQLDALGPNPLHSSLFVRINLAYAVEDRPVDI